MLCNEVLAGVVLFKSVFRFLSFGQQHESIFILCLQNVRSPLKFASLHRVDIQWDMFILVCVCVCDIQWDIFILVFVCTRVCVPTSSEYWLMLNFNFFIISLLLVIVLIICSQPMLFFRSPLPHQCFNVIFL